MRKIKNSNKFKRTKKKNQNPHKIKKKMWFYYVKVMKTYVTISLKANNLRNGLFLI